MKTDISRAINELAVSFGLQDALMAHSAGSVKNTWIIVWPVEAAPVS